MISDTKITQIFCSFDDFCKEFVPFWEKSLLSNGKTRVRKCNGINFIDSTPLRVCHNRRIHQHKTFKSLAERGHCSLGWFYGFKLHIVTNDCGGIIDFMITKGNVDDRKPLKTKNFLKKLFGKLFGDKGYLSKELFTNLFSNGIHLITKLKRNMKSTTVTPLIDAYHLRKRAIIETIFDQLKNIFSALIAYNFAEKKPSLKRDLVDTKQLIFF